MYCLEHKKDENIRPKFDNSYFVWLKYKDVKCIKCKVELMYSHHKGNK